MHVHVHVHASLCDVAAVISTESPCVCFVWAMFTAAVVHLRSLITAAANHNASCCTAAADKSYMHWPRLDDI
jgi:hypothetical protein